MTSLQKILLGVVILGALAFGVVKALTAAIGCWT